jgi:ribonuclease I
LINQTVSNYTFYFQKVVDLYYQYNLKDFLKEIHPGIFAGERKLNKTHILNELEERYGRGRYAITCIKYENKYYLSEVRLKLDLNFELTTLGKTIDNCPEEIYAEFIEVEGPQKQAEGFYKEYDMYFFTILWLGTTCHMKGEQCYENIKVVPKNIFTMHGLWPNLRNGTLADWCNGKNDIEIEIKDETLSEFMNTHYISGYHTNAYFWGHEYNKHGYCYMQRKELDVYDYEYYFNIARKMYLDNDFANIFFDIYKDKIEPGDMQINRKEVENYFDNKGFPKDTYLLVCTNITNKEGEVNPHILEIRIRYDLDFKLLKNETDKSEFDCPELFYAQFL